MARQINGGAVREIRTLLGVEQADLARHCGITQGAMSNIERGKSGASPRVMRACADRLGVSLDSITYPAPEPEPVG